MQKTLGWASCRKPFFGLILIKAMATAMRDQELMTALSTLSQRNVPRYTSYPTAPHFTPRIGPRSYAEWLGALPAGATLSLYLHVPYCTQLCHYCGCTTKATRRVEPIERYAARLREEIGIVGAITGRLKVTHVHWGGGTPSILGESRLKTLSENLAEAFELSAIREHAIELDPRKVTPALARALAQIGVNRVSLGVQDFSPHVQRAIGRVQPLEVVQRSVASLREAGIAGINLDLMYGLPKQTLQDVERTATLAVALEPQRMALFGYAHVPWFKKHQTLIKDADLPSAEERVAQAQLAAEIFEAAGFAPVGLDHFARPNDELAVAARIGTLRRNFQGYTTDNADALLGLGTSSIGLLPQGYVQNAPDVAGYSRAIGAGRLATVRGIALSAEDRLRAHIIERLMCDLSIDLDQLAPGNAAQFRNELGTLQPLADEGLVHIEGARVRVLEKGRPYIRLVAAAFDAYLPRNSARHSLAV